jgi:acetyltransferase-like isoleucine patch superfamily enzyme
VEPNVTHQPLYLDVGVVDVQFGANVKVVRPSNIYGCCIGDDSFIGPFCEIQRGVVLGRRTRVQSHALICELVSIGDDCFVGHGVIFVNDPFAIGGPARGDRTLWRTTTIGNGVSIGSNATILPVKIVDGVVIGAGAVVTRNIDAKGIYAGNPAKLIRRL